MSQVKEEYLDIINQTINSLTVKAISRISQGKVEYSCICVCGKEKKVWRMQLIKGRTKSCGCLLPKLGKHTKQYRGCGDLSGYVWSKIKDSANKRKLDFKINIQEAWELFEKQNRKCALTGLDIILTDSRTSGKQITASLDRIDSKLGYTIDNIQWVHKDVNYIKQNLNEEYFVNLCEKIYNKYKNKIQLIERPSWSDYFIGLAFLIAERSWDAQTKHGCVITTTDNVIVGIGYNSPAKHVDNTLIPNLRDEKYDFFLHSEYNALLNCSISTQINRGCIAYVTGKPCIQCLSALINSNISKIVYADRQGWQKESKESENFDFLVAQSKIVVEKIIPNLNFVRDCCIKLQSMDFIQ